MERGWPGSSHLRFARSVLAQRRRVWFHWPSEQAIECVDADVLASYWRLWMVCTADRLKRRVTGLVSPREPDAGPEIADRCTIALRRLYGDARPVPFQPNINVPSEPEDSGTRVYCDRLLGALLRRQLRPHLLRRLELAALPTASRA
jgi:hypothetical protein